MTIQFYCPQCNQMLQAEESHQGQQSQCPMCNTVFVVPVVEQAAEEFPGVHQSVGFPGVQQQAVGPPAEQAPEPEAQEEPEAPQEPAEPKVFRIICQQCKQELQTPEDMLGQMAMCPYCNAQFELLYEDSVEFQEEQVAARIQQEKQREQFWLKWAIRSAIGVGVMILLMVLYILIKPYL